MTKQRNLHPEELGRLFALPPFCLELVTQLAARGSPVWVCGGTARDLMSGRVPRDLDLACATAPAELCRLLPEAWLARSQAGLELGSLTLEKDGTRVELTSFRREGAYLDGRNPSEVSFTQDLEEDCRRRDFTVNAIYLDPLRGIVVDPERGLEDLAQHRLRTVGPAEERLAADSLRVLRAIRFCAECDLVPDQPTWAAVCKNSGAVGRLSSYRVFHELERLFSSRGRARGLMLLVESGAAAPLIPELAEMQGIPQPEQFHPEGDVLLHTALVLAELPEPVSRVLAWAAVFHDAGKKACFRRASDRIRFDGHDRSSATIAGEWLREHGAPAWLADDVVAVVRDHIRIAALPSFRPVNRNHFLRGRLFHEHLAFHMADCLASHRRLDTHREIGRLFRDLPPIPPEPLLRGRDLLALGMPSGPGIGEMLAKVEEARLGGALLTVEDALAFVRIELERGSGLHAPNSDTGGDSDLP